MHIVPDNGKISSPINFDDFLKVDIRVGTVMQVESFPEAKKPAYKLWVDFGDVIGVKKSSAQITENYNCDDLVGRKILAVVNFPPRQIGKFISEVLTLGFPDANGHVLLASPDPQTANGARLF